MGRRSRGERRAEARLLGALWPLLLKGSARESAGVHRLRASANERHAATERRHHTPDRKGRHTRLDRVGPRDGQLLPVRGEGQSDGQRARVHDGSADLRNRRQKAVRARRGPGPLRKGSGYKELGRCQPMVHRQPPTGVSVAALGSTQRRQNLFRGRERKARRRDQASTDRQHCA